MKIDFLCSDGSPIGVTLKDLWGEGNRGIGVGGSEYAMLTMCQEWHKAGHDIVLYNNPITPDGSPFEQRNISTFNPLDFRDVLIIFRSPNSRAMAARGLKVWWSCDQNTIGDFRGFSELVDKIVCISPRHAQYFAEAYGITNTTVIDIPVRTYDFDAMHIDKIPNRIVFTSVPARGLDNLLRIFPIIQRSVPNISLVITSDYRLWGVGASNQYFINRWREKRNVNYAGALPRVEYLKELLRAQILLYPSNYDELFCVSVSEAQYAKAYPITSGCGALPTTNMGTVLNVNADMGNDKSFANEAINLLKNPEKLEEVQEDVFQKAKERFSPQKILEEWENKIFK